MIIYSKSSKNRRDEYRLVTTIEQEKGKMLVRKKAAHPSARPHLMLLLEKYNKIKTYLNPLKVVEPRLDGDSIIFPYINGRNLQDEFKKHYLNGEEDKAIDILKRFRKILNSFAAVKVDLGKNSEFKKVFGPTTQGEEECLEIGCLDFNLDNLIEKGENTYLIDYEWVFETPLPKDFLYFRSLLYSFVSIKAILEQRCSREYPIVQILPNVFIPKQIFEEEFPTTADLKRFYRFEVNSQVYINFKGHSESAKIKQPKYINVPISDNIISKLDKLENLSKQKDNELNQKDEELKQVKLELEKIYNSRSWKLLVKLKKLKKAAPLTKNL